KKSALEVNFDSPVKLSSEEIILLQAEVKKLTLQLRIAQEKYLASQSQREKFEKLYQELAETVLPAVVRQMKQAGDIRERSVKTLLVVFSDIPGFSKMEEIERATKLDLMRLIGRSAFTSESAMFLNTWGDGIIAGFENPTEGLRCACKFVSHLDVDGISVRVGVNWGAVRVVY